ncbi:MAG: hypothetical protein M3O33_17935 [Cyanobacteriota bacterium]|nr:hypothetical protein [Cyanobacteriota bacterium]
MEFRRCPSGQRLLFQSSQELGLLIVRWQLLVQVGGLSTRVLPAPTAIAEALTLPKDVYFNLW